MKQLISGRAKWIVAIALIAVVGIGAVLAYQANSSASKAAAANTTYSEIVAARQGSVSSTVSLVGQLEAVQSSDMYFNKLSSSTKLLTLQVKAGNTVTAGQVLATVDPASYKLAVDQARSNLQSAEENLAKLKTPATAVQLAKAEVAIAQAESDLRSAQSDLASVDTPNNSALEDALALAQLNLKVAQLQSDLAEHDATAKNERDLLYAVDWHERKISELQDLVAHGRANLEQTNQVASEQEALAKAQADLAVAQVKRQSSLQTAGASLSAAEASVKKAESELATARAGSNTLAMAKAKLAVQSAQVALTTARQNKADLTTGTDAVTLAAAQASVDKKRLALIDAQAAYSATTLTAPFAGTILQTNPTVGNVIGASTKILTVADLSTLQVAATVDETTIKKLSEGQAATVTFDAVPGKTVTGTVGAIPLQGSVQNSVTVYEVPITLGGVKGLPLLVGMTANVKIVSASARGAVLVPATALTKSSAGYSVLKTGADGSIGSAASAAVDVGISDGAYTEITRGLSAGDKVVVQVTASASSSANANQRGGLSIFGFGGFGGFGR